MSKSLDGFQVALFFSQGNSYSAEDVCEAATGSLPDTTERQKATGVTIATVTEGSLQIRFVLNAIRCDIHFIVQPGPGDDMPFSSTMSYREVSEMAQPVVVKAANYLSKLQRVGLVVARVERCASPAAALNALKNSLPFTFDVPPSSEDVSVQYNIRREVVSGNHRLELNQLHNKSIGTAQMIQVGPDGANVKTWAAFRESLDVNTTGIGPELDGGRLSAAVNAIFKTMDAAMVK